MDDETRSTLFGLLKLTGLTWRMARIELASDICKPAERITSFTDMSQEDAEYLIGALREWRTIETLRWAYGLHWEQVKALQEGYYQIEVDPDTEMDPNDDTSNE